jgi:hypothetical protein
VYSVCHNYRLIYYFKCWQLVLAWINHHRLNIYKTLQKLVHVIKLVHIMESHSQSLFFVVDTSYSCVSEFCILSIFFTHFIWSLNKKYLLLMTLFDQPNLNMQFLKFCKVCSSMIGLRPILWFSCSRRFSSCSTAFSQQIAQVVLLMFLFFSFKTVG